MTSLKKKHIWHPCSQMKDYEQFPPIQIKSATGCKLYTKSGQAIIDAVSSWWCKSLGHGHPTLKKALMQQMDAFEHVILANTTNETIETLSEKLCQLIPHLSKVFYAGDGSCAVEVAMKMSIHARHILKQPERHRFITLENSYHGETAATLSVSDVGLYRAPYQALLFDADIVRGIPYVNGPEDPLWHDCSSMWQAIEQQLDRFAPTATALLVEPVIQGAGGMLIYSPDCLRRLRAYTDAHDIHLIADEIMTGLGRTGTALAVEHANIAPDFVCLSKGLTSGWMAFSAVLTHEKIYELFYDDYETGKAFLHSHTYTGNALAASVANAVFTVIENENIYEKATQLGDKMHQRMQAIQAATHKIKNIRALGGMVAADLICDQPNRRMGYQVYQKAVTKGALLRPLGNTIYWLPPLNICDETLEQLHLITEQAIIEI